MSSFVLCRHSGLVCLFVIGLSWLGEAQSAPGNVANTPLFANSNVVPNVFFEVDDSGSMDWEVLTKPHWTACTYNRNFHSDSSNNSCSYGFSQYRADGLIVNTVNGGATNIIYIYTSADGAYNNAGLESFSNAEQQFDWRIFSSDLNVIYYNPVSTYLPWQGTGLGNASFGAALSDPQPGTQGAGITRNLSGFVYEVWEDTHGFSGAAPVRGTNINRTDGANQIVDWWDEHTRYTVESNKIEVERVTYNANGDEVVNSLPDLLNDGTVYPELGNKTVADVQQNIANWYQYHRRRSFVTKAALGSVVTQNPGLRYGLSVINRSDLLFTELPGASATNFSIHNSSLLNDLFDFNWQAFGTPLRRGLENAGEYFDGNLAGKVDPILYECQQNFTVLFTDGFWNGNSPVVINQDVDGDGENDGSGDDVTLADVARYYYQNDLSTLPDEVPKNDFDNATHQHMVTFGIAFGVRGLLQDIDNNGWPEDPSNLSNNRPYNMSWGNPFSGTPQKIDDLWHAAFNSRGTFVSAATPSEVSDSLNRAIGSVGNRLGSGAAVTFSTTSLSLDTNVFLARFNKQGNKWSGDLLSVKLDSEGVFVTQVDPNDSSKLIVVPDWSASRVLNDRTNPADSRVIVSYDKTLDINGNIGNGIPFRWSDLTTEQKNDLRTEPNNTLTTDDVKAEARLNFLRGDKSNEASANGNFSFRNRDSLLGDIINSSPLFVGLPKNNWPDDYPFPSSSGNRYSDYKQTRSTRNGVVYVGANDGMLHGFSEQTGEELLAYIPSFLFSSSSASSGLHFLTDPLYEHRFYVDLSPTVSDVYINKGDGNYNWYSILIGGSRAGGRGIFALDVSDPAQFSESNADQLVLWEFSDVDDQDLGLTFSKPKIVMMNNKRWAAIFGNGYNNKGDGKGKLFIVFLDGGIDGVWTSGSDYIELDTGKGSIVGNDCLNAGSNCNGLSSPHVVDLNGDLLIDRIYAGDILGNMWAFDVSSDLVANWKVAYDNAGSPEPLFVASNNQPITVKPIVVKHPRIKDSNTNGPNLLVYFGTGQYLTDTDVTALPAVQSFYGVWDHGTGGITPNDLFEQRFDNTSTLEDNDSCDQIQSDGSCTDVVNNLTDTVRVFQQYDDNNDGTPDKIDYAAGHQGWKINFNVPQFAGERVVVDPVVHAGLVLFNTLIPDASPCHSGGTSFLMSVEQFDGGEPTQDDPAFDLNGDGTINDKDLVKTPNRKAAPVGIKFNFGLAAPSKVISNKGKSRQFTPGSDLNGSGSGDDKEGVNNRVVRQAGPGSAPIGRFSWQEIR